MTTAYVLTPVPLWNFNDFFAKPLSGGYMKTLLNSNPTLNKPVYSDSGGTIPYTDPVRFGANGMAGPFYWATDVPYRLEIYDIFGILQKVIPNFSPPSTGGGNTTNYVTFKNLLVNTQFLWPYANPAPSVDSALIAPSACDRLVIVDSDEYINGSILYIKSNTTATDQVSVIAFTPGTTLPEASPEYYANYVCTVAGTGETFKDFKYYIKDLRTIENQSINISFSAQSETSSTIHYFIEQNYGDGGTPTAPVATPATPTAAILSPIWQKFSSSIVVPSTGGNSLGTCHNDYTALVIRMPIDQTCNVSHTNAQIAIGNTDFPYDLLVPELVATQIFKTKTGTIKQMLGIQYEPGWVMMNNGSIGSPTSGATSRANIDAFSLYAFLWTNVVDTFAPVAGGRGASATDDFSANKLMTLPPTAGRAMLCIGDSAGGLGAWIIGEYGGVDLYALTVGQLPAHGHDYTSPNTPGASGVGGNGFIGVGTAATTNTGSNEPFGLTQTSMAMNWYIKL
jgi:uncharacterized membrane protein